MKCFVKWLLKWFENETTIVDLLILAFLTIFLLLFQRFPSTNNIDNFTYIIEGIILVGSLIFACTYRFFFNPIKRNKKKLVFLHGSGSDKNAYNKLMLTLANDFDADLISFNAPFKHPDKPDKYKWFNKFENGKRRDAVLNEYTCSIQNIKEQLNNLHTKPENIILIGHSQGGGIAVHIGLEMELSCVISLNGDLPYNISYNKKTQTPVYWLESQHDTYINSDRKKSYQLITNNNNFHFLTLENSTHNDFENDFLKIINDGKIKF